MCAWIEKTRTGLRYVERMKINGEYKKISTPILKDTKQARRAADQRLRERAEEMERPEIENKSLLNLSDIYLSKKDCKESTRTIAKRDIRQIIDILGDAEINAKVINRKLMESNKSAKTINNYLIRFRTFLTWLYTYGYIEEDIAKRIVNLPDKSPEKDPDEKYLEPNELNTALKQLSGRYYYLAKFLVLTGCRIGEAAALTMDDIDNDYIHITKTFSGFGITSPKTKTSVRDISIQPELAELLKEYKEWRLLNMMSRGIRTDLLFFNNRGGFLPRAEVQRDFAKIDCGGKHVHPHTFRHTHVALLAEQGIPLEVIARRLGHENSKITRSIYYHVTEKQKKRDADMIAEIRILSS